MCEGERKRAMVIVATIFKLTTVGDEARKDVPQAEASAEDVLCGQTFVFSTSQLRHSERLTGEPVKRSLPYSKR